MIGSLNALRATCRTRSIELELLLTPCALLLCGLAMVVAQPGGEARWTDMIHAITFVGLFAALSFGLAARGWGEDQVLMPMAALLSSVGLIMARRLEPDLLARYGSLYGPIALKQMIWVLGGMIVLSLVCFLPWRMHYLKHYRYSWLALGLLLVVITMLVGVERNGARLWLDLGIFQFQPVELLKILLVVYLATYLDERRDLIGRNYYLGDMRLPPLPYLVPLLLMWGLTIGLIVVQKDLGAALLFFAVFLAMLYLVTGKLVYTVAGLSAFVVGAAALYPIFSHVRVRLDVWHDPWQDPLGASYQLVQALYSLANGGLAGAGLGLGDPTMVPESHTDFVFTAIAEELGLIGGVGLLLCYALLTLRGYQIALQARDGFQQLLAAGLTTAIAVQALIITGGTTGLIPLTGLTLPFVSYGGSSTLVNFAMIGILMRISAQRRGPQSF